MCIYFDIKHTCVTVGNSLTENKFAFNEHTSLRKKSKPKYIGTHKANFPKKKKRHHLYK